MAAIPTEIEVQPERRNSRANEIVVIGLVAGALLLGLCLASYHPNDPSWNAVGETGAQNWIGTVGANVAAALFQAIGLAAYLIPLLVLAAAWRRFRVRRINAPVLRLVGLIVLVLSSAALLTLANIRPFFDASFNAGGLSGAIISRILVSGLNTIGAAILLSAIAAMGILLATNFSFASFYEKLTVVFRNRFAALRAIPERFRAWQSARRERRQLHRQQKVERAAAKNTLGTSTGPKVLNSEGRPLPASGTAGSEFDPILEDRDLVSAFETFSAATSAKTMAAAAGVGTAPAKKSLWPSRGKATPAAETALVQEMMREAAVKRKTEPSASGSLPFDGRR